MKRLDWFDRTFNFGVPKELLPFHLERLEGTIYRLEHKVKGVSDKILSERYNDKWSIKQHIGHLAEVDQVVYKRIDEILAGVPVMLPAVFEPQDYNSWPIEKAIDFFSTGRLANIRKYRGLSDMHLTKTSLTSTTESIDDPCRPHIVRRRT
jgi:hypothetical protein